MRSQIYCTEVLSAMSYQTRATKYWLLETERWKALKQTHRSKNWKKKSLQTQLCELSLYNVFLVEEKHFY